MQQSKQHKCKKSTAKIIQRFTLNAKFPGLWWFRVNQAPAQCVLLISSEILTEELPHKHLPQPWPTHRHLWDGQVCPSLNCPCPSVPAPLQSLSALTAAHHISMPLCQNVAQIPFRTWQMKILIVKQSPPVFQCPESVLALPFSEERTSP